MESKKNAKILEVYFVTAVLSETGQVTRMSNAACPQSWENLGFAVFRSKSGENPGFFKNIFWRTPTIIYYWSVQHDF